MHMYLEVVVFQSPELPVPHPFSTMFQFSTCNNACNHAEDKRTYTHAQQKQLTTSGRHKKVGVPRTVMNVLSPSWSWNRTVVVDVRRRRRGAVVSTGWAVRITAERLATASGETVSIVQGGNSTSASFENCDRIEMSAPV